MKRWLVLAVLAGCTTPVGPPDAACDGPLFGSPVTSTGLSAAQCGPRCACGATPFDSPVFSSQRLDALKAWALADAGAELTTDPYAQPPPAPDGGVCAVVVIDQTAKTYRLQTFADPPLPRT